MVLSIRHRLGLGPRPAEPDQEPPTPAFEFVNKPQEVEFAGYAEDCRIFGFWRHDGERLSDALNANEEFLLYDVLLAALEDGRTTDAREFLIQRHEILAVRAAGPRGNAARRSRTRPSPVTLQTGPYTIHGYLHGPPGADAVRQIRRRKPMVPLTEAWIEYPAGGELHRARVGPIIVNHEALDWIRHSRDEEVSMPSLPAENSIDPHAKDMTGYITTWER